MNRNILRALCALASAALILSFSLGAAQAAQGSTTQSPASRTRTLSIGKAGDAVTCSVTAQPPVRLSGNDGIQATGRINSCTPQNPAACSIETQIEEWVPAYSYWVFAGPGGAKGSGCPGEGGNTSTATYECTPTSTSTKYQTSVVYSFVYDGETVTGDEISTTASFLCA
jgi:hypothetical protein